MLLLNKYILLVVRYLLDTHFNERNNEQMIQRILNRWAEISKRYYLLIIVIALIIASMSFISAKETEIDTNYMEEIRFMQSEFPGTNTAQILIMVDRITTKTVLEEDILLMTEELLDAVSDVAGVKSVTSVPGVVKVTGINNLLKEIPADKNTLEEQFAAIPKDKRETFVTDNNTAALVIIKTDTGIDEIVVQEIDDAISFVETPDEATFKHASISALFSQMERLMEESRAETIAISLILVFTILYIFFNAHFDVACAGAGFRYNCSDRASLCCVLHAYYRVSGYTGAGASYTKWESSY